MGLPHKASWGDLTQHLTDQNRPVEALGDFRVPASESDIQFLARAPHISHYRVHQLWRRAALRKEHVDKEPERSCAQDGNVVGVEVNRVTPDVIRGEGHGIGRDDEIPISGIDDGCVFANLRSNEEARIKLWRLLQQRSQLLKWKFADWQNLLRLALSHVLMIIDEAALDGQGQDSWPAVHARTIRKTTPVPDVPAEQGV
jgi:hypothetical protein